MDARISRRKMALQLPSGYHHKSIMYDKLLLLKFISKITFELKTPKSAKSSLATGGNEMS